MKRPKYRITIDGEDRTAIKNSWNSATREARNLIRECLTPGESAEVASFTREPLDMWNTLRGELNFITSKGQAFTVRVELLNPEELTA